MEIEIWSDIACPWCYIGKRNFEAALADFEHRDSVTVSWRSFELDPNTPPEVLGDRAEKLAAKYGFSVERARQLEAEMVERAAGVGLDYHLDIARMGNTFDAHRVIHMAAAQGLGAEMKEALLAAYFTDGKLVSDPEVLATVAAQVGLDGDAVRAQLAAGDYADAVRADEATATQLGISGVPMFVVDRTYGVSGAQPPAVLLQMLEHTWSETHPTVTVPVSVPGTTAGGDEGTADSCGVDGC